MWIENLEQQREISFRTPFGPCVKHKLNLKKSDEDDHHEDLFLQSSDIDLSSASKGKDFSWGFQNGYRIELKFHL